MGGLPISTQNLNMTWEYVLNRLLCFLDLHLAFCFELNFPYFCPLVFARAVTLSTVYCLLLTDKEGPTGFDRMCGGVCQHAGSWGESLER